MSRALKWVLGIIGVIIVLLISGVVVAGLAPVETDEPVDMANHGAGSSSVEPAYSGLLREFPPTNEPADNPTTPERVALGHLLFFDPILSANNDMACATCHHPDLGFSDGLATAAGADGVALSRNAPSLWNVAYTQHLFWDGRIDSLEQQALVPLTHSDEMGVGDMETLVAELADNPEYVALFEAAFGLDGVTADNITRALAAFQRTLITDDSPFDRYAAGEFDALTPQQRRGLALFRSGATRCFECHGAPTFASDTFRVVGVDSDDPGRAGVAAGGQFGAFKVPTLRNIALSAPYMHDGSMATLEDVIDFYRKGGGRAHDFDRVDVFVNPFDLSDQEAADLLAFLYALTDETGMPEFPSEVPSGLSVVQRIDNPARKAAAQHNVDGDGGAGATPSGEAQVIVVAEGEPIQAAVDRARPGDTVLIPYGVYNETVAVDVSDITIEGIPNEAREFPMLDGESRLTDGVIASGNNFSLGKLAFRDYLDNGVLVEGSTGVHLYDIYAENVGTYGVYPVRSTNVLVERVEVTGVADAGIYVGQSENAIVRDCLAYGNVAGIELENTLNGEVVNCHAYDNTAGILIFVLPQLTSKISSGTRISGNLVENNNHENFASAGIVGSVPFGVGILLLGADNVEVYSNTIRDNVTAGLAVFSLAQTGMFEPAELDVGPLAEGVYVHDNTFENNGSNPDPSIANLGIPGADIVWDGTGVGNVFDEPDATTFPPMLPSSNWPVFLQRAYGNILGVLTRLVG